MQIMEAGPTRRHLGTAQEIKDTSYKANSSQMEEKLYHHEDSQTLTQVSVREVVESPSLEILTTHPGKA